jgi:hypothetical protein
MDTTNTWLLIDVKISYFTLEVVIILKPGGPMSTGAPCKSMNVVYSMLFNI